MCRCFCICASVGVSHPIFAQSEVQDGAVVGQGIQPETVAVDDNAPAAEPDAPMPEADVLETPPSADDTEASGCLYRTKPPYWTVPCPSLVFYVRIDAWAMSEHRNRVNWRTVGWYWSPTFIWRGCRHVFGVFTPL